jgi:hypothetical protein
VSATKGTATQNSTATAKTTGITNFNIIHGNLVLWVNYMDFYHYEFSKYPVFVAYPVQRWGFSPKRVLFDLSAQHSHSAQRFRDFGSPLPHSLTHSLTHFLTPSLYLTLPHSHGRCAAHSRGQWQWRQGWRAEEQLALAAVQEVGQQAAVQEGGE